jgi:hypothetical protein
VVAHLVKIRHEDEGTLIASTSENARALFGLGAA